MDITKKYTELQAKLNNDELYVLMFKVTKDSDLEIGTEICYKNSDGGYSKIGIVESKNKVDGVYNYSINTAIGNYVASELKLFQRKDILNITEHDIIRVANSINIVPSEQIITYVLENYEYAQKEDEDENWSLVVEQLLYQSQIKPTKLSDPIKPFDLAKSKALTTGNIVHRIVTKNEIFCNCKVLEHDYDKKTFDIETLSGNIETICYSTLLKVIQHEV